MAVILVAVTFVTGVADRHAAAQAREGKAPTAADRRQTADWLWYREPGLVFRYPPGWQVAPILYSTPPMEEAGEPSSKVGLTVTPEGLAPRDSNGIWMGGRQTDCNDFRQTECKCLTVYDAVYTCAEDAETRRIYDLLVTTIENNWADAAFEIVFPAPQDAIHPNQRYTIRWRTKSGTPKHPVDILIHDTSKTSWRDGTVLHMKNVPNSGHYEWIVPASITSPGPYLVEISFQVPQKVSAPALSGARIYSGTSSPFYIQ